MELRLLRYFLAVARENSFTRAAKYLHITQPTLSRQLMDLEEELGQKLLNRETHYITLTPEGMLLRKRAEEILAMVQKTEAEFNSIGENIAGDIHIGGGESEAMNLVADAITELHEAYPDIRYHIYTGSRRRRHGTSRQRTARLRRSASAGRYCQIRQRRSAGQR